MTRLHISRCAIVGAALCACGVESPAGSTEQSTDDPAETSFTEQPGITMQGITMQGITMQGITMQGMTLQGIRFTGATLSGDPLANVRIERGEVVAERAGTTLRGAALTGAHFHADARNANARPPTSAVAEFRVTAITAEDPSYDPTRTGNTFLYTLEQWVPDSGSWRSACPADADGRRVAIPLAAVWNAHGDRVESTTQFTFGCTFGVIAKCYRWGYRPWVTGYGDLAAMHWTCTRLARADYCGDGTPHTRNGTTINVWDTLPAPGPIQHHGGLLPPIGMTFEAGWNTGGAVCLSHARWLLDDAGAIAALCPNRLVAPGLGQTVCDATAEAVGYDAGAKMFNEAYLNLIGP
jgi:hypothetical protein